MLETTRDMVSGSSQISSVSIELQGKGAFEVWGKKYGFMPSLVFGLVTWLIPTLPR